MALPDFQAFYSLNAGNATFKEQAASGELTAGKPTRYFQYTPMAGMPYVLGAFLKLQATLTATGPATPAAGSDNLDFFIGGGGLLQVYAAPGGPQKCESLNRQTAEFVWAVVSNTSFSVGSCPTFASAGTSAVTVYLFVPLGVGAGAIRVVLPGAITGVYSSGVTIAYNYITSYVVSTTWSGTVAFNEQKTPSLGSGTQSIASYVPTTIAPDAVFMQGETSSTITYVAITTTGGYILCQSSDTDVLEQGANVIAPVAGVTYTTSAGFVIAGNQQAFATFQVTFASATTHYVAYLQVAGGNEVPNPQAADLGAPAAVSLQGTPTPTGGVAYAGPGGRSPGHGLPAPGVTNSGGGGRGPHLSGGSSGSIISRRKT